jgi:hypothetical protein
MSSLYRYIEICTYSLFALCDLPHEVVLLHEERWSQRHRPCFRVTIKMRDIEVHYASRSRGRAPISFKMLVL